MVVRMIFRPALEAHFPSNATFQSLSYRQQSTMVKVIDTIASPLYKEDPFHSRGVRSPIMNGTYYLEFLNQDRKCTAAHIIKNTKTDVGWLVDANLLISFRVWESNYGDITTGE